MILPIAILLPILLAACAPFAWRLLGSRWPVVAALAVLGLAIGLMWQLPAAMDDDPIRWSMAWADQLGLTVELRADGFGLLFALIITLVGSAVLSYASGYLGDDPRTGSITGWLLLFMAAMLGLVLADNILFLFVAWEVTSFSSFMLIGTNHRDPDARAGAKAALLVTAAGGLALLGGLVILGIAAGSWQLSQLPAMHEHPWATAAFVLVLLGAATKSAQFPFCFWLPGAMAAPTPISAYLHSATMVKAGVFLLARMHPVLGEHPAWTPTLVAIAAAGMLLVLVAAARATDLKALLAWSTVGALALMVCLIGIGTDKALDAMVVFLLAHACYKGPLFLVAGSIDHGVHTRDVTRLGGLMRTMPWTITAGLIAATSMIGLPPLLGFVGKELALAAGLKHAWWLAGLFTLLAAAFVYVAATVVLTSGFGRNRELADHAHEAGWSMRIPMLLLALCGLAMGVLLGGAATVLMAPAVRALGAEPYPAHLWHGFNLPLLLSVVAVGLGLCWWWWRPRLARLAPPLPNGRRIHEAIWNGMVGGGKRLTLLIQNGSLTSYVAITVIATCVLVLVSWGLHPGGLIDPPSSSINALDLIIGILIAVGAFGTAIARHRLPAIAGLGVVGMGVTLFFLANHAPDLAMTQFLVEILSVVLLVVAFRHLPDFRAVPARTQLGRLAIALLVGITMTLLVLVALSTNYNEPISDFHRAHALSGGHGSNVVNVILVDFRALDTLGEISVLGIAAIGVIVLVGRLRRRRTGEESEA